MSITVEVGLVSGKTTAVKADLDEEVGTLKRRAQMALGVGAGRLVGSSGSVLDACAPIKRARLQNGDLLTLHINRVQVQAGRDAFAAILGDGSILTWGDAEDAEGSVFPNSHFTLQDELQNVQQIQASASAFAVLLSDGTAVTCGESNCSAVQDQLKTVKQIQASRNKFVNLFAAILGDGSVVTWGYGVFGGDSSAVQGQLKNVQHIQATAGAFAAILGDGSVVTWGFPSLGGDSSAVKDQLKNVQQVQASDAAFAAILGDGSVVTWGDAEKGGDSSAVQDRLKNVQQIQSSESAFAAILGDQLKNVQQIQASIHALAAILGDGSVVTWGDAEKGGDSSTVQDRLRNVKHIQATACAFAAILGDGSVVTWGAAGAGGDSSAVQDQLKDVQQIQASDAAFAAILGDGSVVTWYHAEHGGDSSAVQDQLKNVQQIQASDAAFAAVLGDGSIVTWGHPAYGGDSSAVQDRLTEACAGGLRWRTQAYPQLLPASFLRYYQGLFQLRPLRDPNRKETLGASSPASISCIDECLGDVVLRFLLVVVVEDVLFSEYKAPSLRWENPNEKLLSLHAYQERSSWANDAFDIHRPLHQRLERRKPDKVWRLTDAGTKFSYNSQVGLAKDASASSWDMWRPANHCAPPWRN
ncbi:unnamed protein product, partial [Symbiodinium sp. KB8]